MRIQRLARIIGSTKRPVLIKEDCMNTVKDILKHKGTDVWTITPEDTIFNALNMMKEKNVGAVVVVGIKGNVEGIFSERDFVRYCAAKDMLNILHIPIKEVMTPKVICVDEDQTIDNCMALMTDKRLRHLPVLDKEQLIGLISIGDVVKAMQHEKDILIDQLEHYITGSL